MENIYKKEFLNIPPIELNTHVNKSGWPLCLRCKEREPWVKKDWPFKGLCSECIEIESRPMKKNW